MGHFADARVNWYKSKNYNRNTIATLAIYLILPLIYEI
jgi:hypothetical protein